MIGIMDGCQREGVAELLSKWGFAVRNYLGNASRDIIRLD